ncbi:unnamed protein product, partial [Anisakis simplex]|uniref:DUF3943 domain-containing protein n=1 Tax=Anisakis simplex TaxID=6269 RepID=A0A0M3JF38_ANISI
MAVPATVLYFSTYDSLLHWLRSRQRSSGDMAWWSPMLAGAEIGMAIKRSHRADGLLTFWRGWAPTLMRDLPFSGSVNRLNRHETTFSISFVSGALSGSLAAFLTA